jgi:uncharacterized protein YecE (DUF72 family)
MRVHVGTSGYNYTEWRGSFYPQDLPTKAMFEYYSARFHTVEINYTFYRMPTTKTTGGWLAQAPPGFAYTLKAPQKLTHIRRLKDAQADLEFFCDSARVLGPHLASLLFQLPPTFKCDTARLETFLAGMPADMRPAFEFRHDSWLNDDVYAILAAKNAALCIADFGDKTTPLRATANHGYFRLRDEGYTTPDLEKWAAQLIDSGQQWNDAFVYFKHEDAGKGPEFAREFVEILSRRGVSVTEPPRGN